MLVCGQAKAQGLIEVVGNPILTDEEISYILDAIEELAAHFQEWGKAYCYDPKTNEYHHEQSFGVEQALVANWFGKNLG